MIRITSIILLVTCSCTFAQVSTDEATKRLQEKQAAKQAHRDKVVTITQGELDDMKALLVQAEARIKQLTAEAAALRAEINTQKLERTKLNQAADNGTIVLGMTREEAFEAFKKRQSGDWNGDVGNHAGGRESFKVETSELGDGVQRLTFYRRSIHAWIGGSRDYICDSVAVTLESGKVTQIFGQ